MSGIMDMLRARFPKEKYALFEEVRNGAGFNATRSCDAMVMALWPSDGLALHGIEIKVSRSDWLRELKQPEKSDEFMAVCDYWWLAVDDREIVKLEELPEKWGLLAPRGKSLVVVKQAPRLAPLPMDRGTLASLFKRAAQSSASAEQIESARKLGYAQGKRDSDHQSHTELARPRETEKLALQFQEASGVRLERYAYDFADVGKIGEVVKLLLADRGRFGGYHQRLTDVSRALESAAVQARAAAEQLRAVESPDAVAVVR